MTYWTDLFSPETYEAFSSSARDVSGFRPTQAVTAKKIKVGDKFLCYMTKFSRWVGVLEVCSECFGDSTPIFYPEDDPFTIRFKVKPLVWLPKEQTVPIREPRMWENLSFTKDCDPSSGQWTGRIRSSLRQMSDEDGSIIEQLLLEQLQNPRAFEIDDEKYRLLTVHRVRRSDKMVSVSVPEESDTEVAESGKEGGVAHGLSESLQQQAILAEVGEQLGMRVWIPRSDRSRILTYWKPAAGGLLEHLPLNYDEVTLKTIENIDVLWIKGRSILRAFEVEHTTSIYSGILRMADLLALQPNMDIKLHIVAPAARREKVFQELMRPVFSLLERKPLSECCSFISYESLEELTQLRHLAHLSDSILDEYGEFAE
jgi:predicted RNA-binding protein